MDCCFTNKYIVGMLEMYPNLTKLGIFNLQSMGQMQSVEPCHLAHRDLHRSGTLVLGEQRPLMWYPSLLSNYQTPSPAPFCGAGPCPPTSGAGPGHALFLFRGPDWNWAMLSFPPAGPGQAPFHCRAMLGLPPPSPQSLSVA